MTGWPNGSEGVIAAIALSRGATAFDVSLTDRHLARPLLLLGSQDSVKHRIQVVLHR